MDVKKRAPKASDVFLPNEQEACKLVGTATSILRSIHCHGSFPSLSSSAVRKAQSPNAAKIRFHAASLSVQP